MASTSTTNADGWSQFFKDINARAMTVMPGFRRYERVLTLLTYWEYSDPRTREAITGLETVLCNKYHYTTEQYQIPSYNSDLHFEQKLADWQTRNDSRKNLLILYYGGYGQIDEGSTSGERINIWRANRTRDSPTLDWSQLHPILAKSQADVLFLFDCCYTSQGLKGVGSKEVLWAGNSERTEEGVRDNSFTQNLTQELEDLCGTRFHIRSLQYSLALRGGACSGYPWHMFVGSANQPSIELIPQPRATIPTTLNTRSVVKEDDQERETGARVL